MNSHKIPMMRNCRVLAWAACLLMAQPAFGAVVILGTRVIYPSDARSVNITMSNRSDSPMLMQAWVDCGDEKSTPENTKAPYILSPSIARIDPKKDQIVRLIYTGKGEAPDKESLCWLNTLEVPPAPAGLKNYIQFDVHNRLKLLYRPVGLKGNSADAPAAVEWHIARADKGWVLEATNPSAFVVSLIDINPMVDGQAIGPGLNATLLPGSTRSLSLPDVKGDPARVSEIHYTAINDIGGYSPGVKVLNPHP